MRPLELLVLEFLYILHVLHLFDGGSVHGLLVVVSLFTSNVFDMTLILDCVLDVLHGFAPQIKAS